MRNNGLCRRVTESLLTMITIRAMTKQFFLILLLGWISIPVFADHLTGKVVGVSDGDTVTFLETDHTRNKIRLSGIDAPEKKQPYGQASKEHLSKLCFGKEAIVDWHKHDKYGRVVGQVFCDGKDVGLEQIRAGMAWWYQRYAKEQHPEDRSTYERAEKDARVQRVGLWRDENPTAPWEYRHSR